LKIECILKIGGTVITDKAKGVFDKAKTDVIKRIAKEVATNPPDILIHGVGSFGHPYVEKHNLIKDKRNIRGVADTHLACERLCSLVCKALADEGLNPIPIHPFTFFRLTDQLEFDSDFIEGLVKEGFIPVIHGDMVIAEDGYEVLSGDRIAAELTRIYNVGRLGFASDTAVIAGGKVVEEINTENINILESGNMNKSDVTGGMKGKIMAILDIARQSEVFIFSGLKHGNVARFLAGENVGTRIRWER